MKILFVATNTKPACHEQAQLSIARKEIESLAVSVTAWVFLLHSFDCGHVCHTSIWMIGIFLVASNELSLLCGMMYMSLLGLIVSRPSF